MNTSPEPAQLNGRSDIVATTVAPIHPFSDDPEASIPKVDADPLAEPSALLTPLAASDESGEEPLEELASQIQQAHLEVTRASAAVVAFAVRAGQLLLKARPRVPDAWEKWVEEHCSFSVRRAQEYMMVARAVDEGRIDVRHAASVREVLLQLREESQTGGGRSEARHAAPRARKTLSTLPKQGGTRKEDRGPAAAKSSADPAELVPDLMVWDESRQRFVSLTIQLADVTLADADPASRAHFRQSVQETINVLSKYSDCPEGELE